MPYHYTIDPKSNLAHVKAWGFVRGEEIVASTERMAADPCWRRGMHQLCNFLGVQAVAVTLDQMKRLAELERHSRVMLRGGQLALVADTFDVILLCELYSGLTRSHARETRIFHTVESAADWLGTPSPGERRAPVRTVEVPWV